MEERLLVWERVWESLVHCTHIQGSNMQIRELYLFRHVLIFARIWLAGEVYVLSWHVAVVEDDENFMFMDLVFFHLNHESRGVKTGRYLASQTHISMLWMLLFIY